MSDKRSIKEILNMKISARKLILILIDITIIVLVYAFITFMFWLYALNKLLSMHLNIMNAGVLIFCLLLFRLVFGIYSSVWRYANSYSYLKLIILDFAAGITYFIITIMVGYIYTRGWQSISIVCIITLATLASRFVYQQYHSRCHHLESLVGEKINVVIIGAGQIGVLLASELKMNSKSRYNPYCFVDIDKEKIGNKISGIKVIEADNSIIEKLKQMPVKEIIIAIPKLNGDEKQKLYRYYEKTGLKIKIYDFMFSQEGSDENKRVIRDIKIEDLLFRESINIGDEASIRFYKGKRILITGGGGSIGSELCRQLARCKPEQLIILDIYENNAYEIQQELLRLYGSKLNLAVEIASVRERERLDCIFRCYKPHIVFHAAAHKHVPLMEHNGCEAVKNNIMGTYNTADMAEKYGAEKFILISTDKAVNPTNIMGASKRMCEMIIQCRTDSKTSFASVRFGNVLGSNGSVIPLFKKQVEDGGPITITDKRIIRYFMTIPEASQLVMHAGIMARKGELFVLDMGKPVRIVELAENMIRLSGLTPYKDIDIVEIGLRPGEKLYEELLLKNEDLTVTVNKLIFIEKDTPFTRAEIDDKLDILRTALIDCTNAVDSDVIKRAMKNVVSTYDDPETVNGNANNAVEMKGCYDKLS
ncbi:MAG: hypothetical protein A2Y17_08505 [Clostridiales bacterium GWF2_38_85]|nr:MAG: hypothetical protein A2Y17_08505 [Clostridiales bacterium GWF2_38_85]HBL83766.1 polysaccharide biosynthesis protein [Clostridiales bacterium]